MIRLGEIELILKIPQTNNSLPILFSPLLTLWSQNLPNAQLQSHMISPQSPPEQLRLSLFSRGFNCHVSLNQIHLHWQVNLENQNIQSYLFNFYNQHQKLIKEVSQVLKTEFQVRVAGKVFYPFKTIYSDPREISKKLHEAFVSFPSLGKNTEFRLNCAYEEKDHYFRFQFQDYQLRQINLPPGSPLTPEILSQSPVSENGLEVFLDLTHIQKSRSLDSDVVNILRLFSLNIDSLPSNFFNNLLKDLKTSGPTFN